MVGWIELIKERYLSVDKMNAVYNDFLYISEKLSEKGYSVSEITDSSVTYNISPKDIIEKMNAVEANIQAVNDATDWINPYYSLFEWLHKTNNKKTQVDRWIMYLNFAYDVLSGKLKGTQYLIDINGNYITDKRGNYILVYKEESYG